MTSILHVFGALYTLLYIVCGAWFAWNIASRKDGLESLLPVYYGAMGTFWLMLAGVATLILTGHVHLGVI